MLIDGIASLSHVKIVSPVDTPQVRALLYLEPELLRQAC